MLRPYFLAIMFLCATIAQAQHPTGNKTTATKASRLIGFVHHQLGTPHPYDSMQYIYHHPYSYDSLVGEWKYDTANRYLLHVGSEELIDWYVQSFDPSGQLNAKIRNTNMGGWYVSYKWKYNYMPSGLLREVAEAKARSTTPWDSMFYSYTYNAQGRQLSYVEERQDAGALVRSPTLQFAYSYNAQGQPDTTTREGWDVLLNMHAIRRYVYTYNTAGLNDSLTIQLYKAGNWENEKTTEYKYDATGKLHSEEVWHWKINGWEPVYYITYSYDMAGNKAESVVQEYTGGQYYNHIKQVYTYNSYNQPVIYTMLFWDAVSQQFVGSMGAFEERFYYEEYTTGIKDNVKAIGTGISILPNPARHTLRLRTTFANATAAQVTMTDMTGRMVRQLQLPAARQYDAVIDVSGLPAGNYTISVKADGILMTEKVVVAE